MYVIQHHDSDTPRKPFGVLLGAQLFEGLDRGLYERDGVIATKALREYVTDPSCLADRTNGPHLQ